MKLDELWTQGSWGRGPPVQVGGEGGIDWSSGSSLQLGRDSLGPPSKPVLGILRALAGS